MEQPLAARRGMSRVGAIFTALAGASLVGFAFVLASESGGVAPELLLALAPSLVLGGIGIGLLYGAKAARVLGVVLLAGCVVVTPIGVLFGLGELSTNEMGPGLMFAVANMILSAALAVYVCYRAIQAILARTPSARRFTARLVGATSVAVAMHHLWLAYPEGFRSLGFGETSWSINVSPLGTTLIGFAGWPLWHVALLAVGGILVAGPLRLLSRAAAALAILLITLGAAIIARVARDGMIEMALSVIVLCVPFGGALLAWWLRDELRSSVESELDVLL